jgi:hypothetical protein
MYPGIPSLSGFKSRQRIFIGALLLEQFSICLWYHDWLVVVIYFEIS